MDVPGLEASEDALQVKSVDATPGGEAKPKEKVPERRLWLYGSVAASAGTCGLYRTARTEPMGERLRLLFNGDPVLTPVRGNKQDPAGWCLDISGPWNPDET